MKMNVGCGRNIMEGWVNIDSVALRGVDIVCDLNDRRAQLCCDPNQFDEFLLSHVIEHLTNPLAAMETLWDWAKPDALMTIRCPYGTSDDADEDPTHVRRMFPGSFHYFGQPYYWRADYGYRGDWIVEKCVLKINARHGSVGDSWMTGLLNSQRNVVDEMVVTMRAVKPRRPPDRNLQNWVQPEYHR